MKNIDILYEDNFIIIVNKPAGLSVQGGKEVKSSLDKILAQSSNSAAPPLLVHRLDKDTSGVLLAAKGRESAAKFSRLLNEKTKKQYIAVCAGCPKKEEDIIIQELFVRGKMKEAKTKYKVIKSGRLPAAELENSAHNVIENVLGTMPENELLSILSNVLENSFKGARKKEHDSLLSVSQESGIDGIDYSVLELELGTGRMHQIRRHLAMIGNPIIGDDKYGDFSLNKKLRKSGVKRLLLHASRLIINDGFNLDVQAPLPEYFNLFT